MSLTEYGSRKVIFNYEQHQKLNFWYRTDKKLSIPHGILFSLESIRANEELAI